MGLLDGSGIWILVMGKTIVHSLWIGLLILALLRISLILIPALDSRSRYRISVSALALLFCSVIITFIVVHEPLVQEQDAMLARDLPSPFPGYLLPDKQDNTAAALQNIFAIFGYVYLLGVLAMLFRSLFSLGYIRQLKSSGSPIDPVWQKRFTQIIHSMSIKGPVKLLRSTRVKGPLLVGFLKPVILIPAGMLSNLPASQIETILMHELYHLKRRDYLINIMQLFIEGLLFYHPAVWIISGIVRNEREHCCDDGVLEETSNPENYARALIHIAEQQEYSRLAPGAAGTKKYHLKSRIYRILNIHTMKTNLRDRVISLALLAGSLILFVTISGFSAGPSFFRFSNLNSEHNTWLQEPKQVLPVADTIPQEAEAEDEEELEEIDFDELKEEMEEARLEVLEELEQIDWEAMKEEIEEARQEALEEIEEIDWEKIRAEMELNISEMKIDMEEMKKEIENSMKEIDWDKIKKEMEESMTILDSLRVELDH